MDEHTAQTGTAGRAKQATAMPVLPSPGSAVLQRELNHTGISWSPVQGPGKGWGSLEKTRMAMGTCLGGSSYVRKRRSLRSGEGTSEETSMVGQNLSRLKAV